MVQGDSSMKGLSDGHTLERIASADSSGGALLSAANTISIVVIMAVLLLLGEDPY